jgi:hypothetical protein
MWNNTLKLVKLITKAGQLFPPGGWNFILGSLNRSKNAIISSGFFPIDLEDPSDAFLVAEGGFSKF